MVPEGGGFYMQRYPGELDLKSWKKAHWIVTIFDRAQSTINKYHVGALLYQLIASKLIGTEWKDNQIVWILCDDDNNMAFSEYLYEKTKIWDGTNLQGPTTA